MIPTDSPDELDQIVAALVAELPAEVAGWFRDALAGASAGGVTSPAFARAWSGAGRRLGRASFEPAPESVAALAPLPRALRGWARDEAGRALMLLAALGRAEPQAEVGAVGELWRTGEVRERQALMKALAYLPAPERFAPLAAEAVRTHMMSVFEALACDNPFPARHLPPLPFRQLVVKALQSGVSLRRLVELSTRLDPELRRMVEAFASERRAAGRPVPEDADLVLGDRQR